MKAALLLLFVLLWYGNSHICGWVYPYDYDKESTWGNFENWYYLRDQIYEFMFLVLASTGLYKNSRLSKAVASGIVVLLGASVVDKLIMGVFDFQIHDVYVFIAACLVALRIYYGGRS